MKKYLICLLTALLLLPSISFSAPKLATLINRDGLKIVVVAGSQTAQQYFGDGFVLYTGEPLLGFTVVSNYKTTLSRSISSTASTIYVSSLTTKDSHVLTMADLGTKVFFTLEPGSNKEEIVMCTGIGTLSWTTCTRGLAFYATSTSAVTANQKSHSAGSAIVMSNVHYVYDQLVDKDTANTIDGVKTYTSYPQIQTYVAPTTNIQFAPKKYVDDTINAGAPDATEGVKGVSELATGAEAAAGTSSGSAARLVLPASIATSTSQVAQNSIPVTLSTGKLDNSFLNTTSVINFLNPVGSVTAYASSTVPTGWLAANGQFISTSTYATLFALIGYTYATTTGTAVFPLPDLSGKNIIGYGTTTPIMDTMGETGGATSTTLTIPQMPSHTHDVNGITAGTNIQNTASYTQGNPGSVTSTATGGGQQHSNMDPFIVLQYIIKY